MKFAFMPIGIAAGFLAGQLSKKIFDFIWGVFADEEAPRPKHREIDFVKLPPPCSSKARCSVSCAA